MNFKKLITAAAIVAASATAGSAATYIGSNNPGDGSWARPIRGLSAISTFGPVNYDLQIFSVSADGHYDFSSVQTYDGYLHVYETFFDPTDQPSNLLAGNDDGVGGIGTSNIDDLALFSGQDYFLITSAFQAGQTGTFTNEITGAGDVYLTAAPSAVPLPAGGVLLISGLMGLAAARRKKKTA
ncbi:hypothetical protein C1J03_08780 [Sulfitobacter sp. SK012]|uniref:VPLPA-CTERM sorting domain-containing protein n=1 Tax=Sulfitobacter sp. SK012 TaxID=1389005 RepID=UPI000E0A46B0|nr:VPLPA-CTERM sorting domain-containing protein [Sulfitobacter sp. SK012]AXI46103.1 hypothetical protein C1J03_08780 [Sulfitobacter sp. SK012]